jgi:tetratricopeptide (TPR) repeat protein
LLPVYPKWNIDTSSLRWWIPLGATICAVALIFRFRRLVGKELLWAIGNSIIPLLPVLGFFSFAYFHLAFVADHFLYLPMIGFAHAVAHIAERLRNRWSRPMGSIVAAALAAYLVFLTVQTVQRVGVWTNSVTLWTRSVHGNPGNWKIHTFLGHALVAEGRHEEALKEFRLALAQNLSELARVNRWGIEMGVDSDREGLQSLARSQADLRRQVASAHYNVALALLRMSETNGAREHLKKALRQRPEFVKALNNLAATYLMEGRPRDAIPWLERAISIEVDNAELHRNLAVAFAATGEEARARRHFEKAQELQRVLGRSKR